MAEQTTTPQNPVAEIDNPATPNPDTNTDYIAAIARMRANMVPKEDFEKVQNEKKQLLEALVEGG